MSQLMQLVYILEEKIGTEKLKKVWSKISWKICLAYMEESWFESGLSGLNHLYSILSHDTCMEMVIVVLEQL